MSPAPAARPPAAALLGAPCRLGRRFALLLPLLAAAACRPAAAPPAAPTPTAVEPAAATATPPPGEYWLTPAQVASVGLQVVGVGEGAAGAPLVVSGRIAFDDLQVARVIPPVNGHVTQVLVAQGDHVRRGQALATMASPDLGQVIADIESSHADFLAADRDLVRTQALYNDRAVAEKTVEAAVRRRGEAAAEYARARDKSTLLGATAGAEDDTYVVRAPIEGNVIVRSVAVGTDVQGQYENGAAAPELFTLGSLESVWAIADVFEMDVPHIQLGDRVQVQVVAYPDEVFEGRVDWMAPGADEDTRATRLRCRLANPHHRLKPEMFVTLRIFVDGERGVVVPASALFYLQGRHYVYVQEPQPGPAGQLRFVRREVTLGPDAGGRQGLVRTGLTGGEQVVSRGGILFDGV